MTDHVYIAVQAYGDNVVSFRLLRELRGHAELTILGTDLTREIAELLGFDAFPIVHLPGGLFSFYNIRTDGLVRATRDFFALRRAIRSFADRRPTLLFENQRRPGTHRALHLLGGKVPYHEPVWRDSAYYDRRRMLEQEFQHEIPLSPALFPPAKLRKVMIAPAARKGFRNFPPEIVGHLIQWCASHDAVPVLVDPLGQYAQFERQVGMHIARRPLAESVLQLRDASLVFAPDSLFMHLAYYLRVPVVAVVPGRIARDFYFAPPGMLQRRLYVSFGAAAERRQLFEHLDSLVRM